MADEEKKKLDVDDLKDVAGGYIVKSGPRSYTFYDDETDDCVGFSTNVSQREAQQKAQFLGISDEIRNPDNY